MITNLGPGIVPTQFAFIRTLPSTALYLFYWAVKYVSRPQLKASGWDTTDPVFYDRCNGARPQGAVELSWLPRRVLQGKANPTLPRIPRNQVRYMSARTFAVLAKSLAGVLKLSRPVFESAAVGASLGVGVTCCGPIDMSVELDLTDSQGRREHYAVSLSVQSREIFLALADNNPQSPLNTFRDDFSNGGVTFRLTYQPLTAKGCSKRSRVVDVIFPLDTARVLLAGQSQFVFLSGRIAALL